MAPFREGGWPKDVKTELMEQKNKFIRKVLKEDMFKYSTTKLGKSMEKVLKQNITLDIEELYFTDVEEAPDHEVCLTSPTSCFIPVRLRESRWWPS